MSCILYYSNFCNPSKKILYDLGRTSLKDDIHFVCIDKRLRGEDNAVNILLPNGQALLLPPTVVKVPALLLLYQGNRILFGNDIYTYFKPKMEEIKNRATKMNQEPLAFSFTEMGNSLSDTYSYLDLKPDDLSAKGDGGLRILHNYVTLEDACTIETPPENYVSDKIGDIDMGKVQQARINELLKH